MIRRLLAAPRIVLGLSLACLAVFPQGASAQYFGQNKVHYKKFGFKVLQTEHFDIYFYDETRAATMDAARIAERSYARLSRILNHEFQERKPIILYASPNDFQQTNTTPGDIGEGTGGFTDFLKHRNVMPFTGSYADLEHVLTHEMTHQFQFDVWSRGKVGNIAGIIAANAPLWFGEGMAEYMSLGPVTVETAMWLRDAVLENRLPTIDQLTYDPNIFPYRYGHAVLSFIAERWGDEALGAILKSMNAGGLDGALRRVLGVTQKQLSDLWRDAVQKQYLPELGDRVKANAIAQALLTEEKSGGSLHLAPAMSPDGADVAYFSERNGFFVDFWLADGNTGKVKRKLLGSTLNPDYETFRFLNSAASFSPDGRYLAFAAKHGERDDINIFDLEKRKVIKRITVELNSITTPSWSPDGERLVFTGYHNGVSDLFTIRRDGTDLQQLTDDRYADLHPVWSPDGTTIAFTTDRGPRTDFTRLVFGNYRVALLDVATGRVRDLPHMDQGRNANPQWAPDGRSFAFVSDRDGVSNIYLYDLDQNAVYQITNFFTGVSGFTPLSPVLSWARKADRLAFVYYEKGKFDVYAINNPRALRRQPYVAAAVDTAAPSLAGVDAPAPPVNPQVREGGSLYRSPSGFRPANDLALPGDSLNRALPPQLTVRKLIDSTSFFDLPDTAEFKLRRYRTKFEADYVAQPTIGFVRDNFGRGFFGGTSVQLSDMLGNQQLLFSGFINGRISEANISAAYVNLSSRTNWAIGVSQAPLFFIQQSQTLVGQPTAAENTFVTNIRRLVFRSVNLVAARPFNRFMRVEAGIQGSRVDDGVQQILEAYDPLSGFPTRDPAVRELNLPSVNFVRPSLALVYDKTLFGYVGPFIGSRYRFEVAPTVGDWRFFQATADYRRYDRLVGPIVLATRAYYFGRNGRDADLYPIFLGVPELLRGNTSGSYRNNECLREFNPTSLTGCPSLDRLIGTNVGVFNAEIRFPILSPQFGWVPSGIPPIEGALFYDAGLAWDARSKVKWKVQPGDNPSIVRAPLQSIGFSVRMNAFGFAVLRLDYAVPQERPNFGGLWTLSVGPTF
ncbi:MAG: BamA/TamA family outer membrane protein [Gemmatimonadota bacterium]